MKVLSMLKVPLHISYAIVIFLWFLLIQVSRELSYCTLQSKREGLTVLNASLLGGIYLEEVRDRFFWENFLIKKDRMFNFSIIPVLFPSE